MNEILKTKWEGGKQLIFPTHPMVRSWVFDEEEEAILAHSIAVVAEKNRMTANDLQHLFPAILRMLKSDTSWSK